MSLERERESYTIQQVEEFRASNESGDCRQIPQRSEEYSVSREQPEGCTLMGGLRSLGFPLEVRIGNDTATFHTTYLAGIALPL